jgi:hypothetical protein
MKKNRATNAGNADGPRKEYRIDYTQSRSNRFAKMAKEDPLVVMVDADVAQVFSTSESVNKALRAVIAAFPESSRKRLNK